MNTRAVSRRPQALVLVLSIAAPACTRADTGSDVDPEPAAAGDEAPAPAPASSPTAAAAKPSPAAAVSFPALALRCAGPEGVDDCAPAAFEATFADDLPFLRANRAALEERWLADLEGGAHAAAYGLAWLRSERALPLLRSDLLRDRYFYGWESDDAGQLEAQLRDDQYPHHLAYIAAIEAISGRPVADAVDLRDDERDRLVAELPSEAEEDAGAPARWLLGKLLRPPAAIEPIDAISPASSAYFFYDGCWAARAPTKPAAARACAKAQRAGDRWSRRWCRCRPNELVEVRADDPIAYYLYGASGEENNHCGGAGPTPLAAWRACTIRQLEVRARWPESACACPTKGDAGAGPTAVRGPYTRARTIGEFDDPEAYAYLDPGTGDWLDRYGELPCFVAGTPVATPRGPRAIEALRPGDAVIAWDLDAGEEVVAEVVGRRVKSSPTLLRLTLASGETITTTANHPFFAKDADAWLDAGALRPGDVLLTRTAGGDAADVAIASIEALDDASADDPAEVFSISVTPPHTYFAGGVLVHNY